MFAPRCLSVSAFVLALFMGACGYVQLVGFVPDEGARVFAGPGSLFVAGSATDADGNHYLVGRVEGVVDLGSMQLEGGTDETAFVVSFSPSGSPRWLQTWSGSFSLATSVDVRADRVVVTGYMRGPISGPIPVTTGGRQELFVFDFERESGAPMPPARTYASATGNVQGKSIASAGVFSMLSGHYVGSVDFGLGMLPASSPVSDYGFVAVFDSLGEAVWSEAVAGADVLLNAAFVRADGSAVAAGVYSDGTIGGRAAEGGDGVVVGFGSDGSTEFELGFGATGADQVIAVAPYEDGAIIVGFYEGDLNIGGVDLASRGERDTFVARLGRGGEVVWARSLDGTGREILREVAVEGGRIYVAGTFDDELRFAGDVFPSMGGDDVMVLVFDADGGEVAGQQLGGAGDEMVGGMQLQGGQAWLALVLSGETVLDESGPQEGVLGLRTLSF